MPAAPGTGCPAPTGPGQQQQQPQSPARHTLRRPWAAAPLRRCAARFHEQHLQQTRLSALSARVVFVQSLQLRGLQVVGAERHATLSS